MVAQVVIATPVLLFLLLAIVQFAIWSLAAHVAQAAAAQGLDAARLLGGTAAAGQQRTGQVLAQLDTGPLVDARVNVVRGPRTVTVSVTGTAEQIIPFLRLPVHAQAAGVTEVFTTP